MNDKNFQEQRRQAFEFVGNCVYAVNECNEVVPISITSMSINEEKKEIILKFYEDEICYFSDLDKEQFSIYSSREKAEASILGKKENFKAAKEMDFGHELDYER